MKTTKVLISFLIALAWAGSAQATADKSMLNQKLPELKLDYLNGRPTTAGKPMIVEFWATWCPPCRTSIPHLNEIYKKHKGEGLVVIGITQEKRDVITQFLQKVPMNYSTALDLNGAFSRQFAIQGIPHALLVDKTGKVVWEGHPMALTEKQIAAVLK